MRTPQCIKAVAAASRTSTVPPTEQACPEPSAKSEDRPTWRSLFPTGDRHLGTSTEEDLQLPRYFESVSANPHEGLLVQIVLIRQERCVDVGGELWLSLDAVPWLIEALDRCLDTLESSETEIGSDSLRVKEKGHELDPKVGIGNERSGLVPYAGRYFLAMREKTARTLMDDLRALTG